MLIVITLIACVAAWVHHKHEQARRQWEACNWARQRGDVISHAEPELPPWQQKLFGYFRPPRVFLVHLHQGEIANLEPLAELPHLRTLKLQQVHVPDPSALGRLENLESLRMDGCWTGSLESLAEMPKLTELSISNPPRTSNRSDPAAATT